MSDAKTNKYKITWDEFEKLCDELGKHIHRYKYDYLYPIPKNGLFVAERLSKILNLPIIHQYEYFMKDNRILIVDDLVDSGETLNFFDLDKAVLIVKNNNEKLVNYYVKSFDKLWIEFPWEKEKDIKDTVIRQLEYIGENPKREGLINTPDRIIRSWNKLFGGYRRQVKDVLKTFEDGACDELVILKDIEFYSTCEHHFLPFFGKIHIGYIPNGKIVGVSKLARLVEIYSRRLQIQERLTNQIADDLEKYLKTKGVMVIAEAQHFCMTSRGVEKQQSKMITSAIRGVFIDKLEARMEFLNLIK